MTERYSAAELADELGSTISMDEVQSLKLNDEEWSLSAAELFVKMTKDVGRDAQDTINAAWKALQNEDQHLTKDDLRKMGLDELKRLRIPLCVRHWLENNVLVHERCQQESDALTESKALVADEPSHYEGREHHVSAAPAIEPGRASLIGVSMAEPEESMGGMRSGQMQDSLDNNTDEEEEILLAEIRDRSNDPKPSAQSTHEEQDCPSWSDLKQWMQIELESDECKDLSGASLRGTVLHIFNEKAIVLMENNLVTLISRERKWKQGKEEQPEFRTSLIAAFSQGALTDNGCRKIFTEFYATANAKKLNALANASKVIIESQSYIQFHECLGSGGYGFVFSVTVAREPYSCVKVELDDGLNDVSDIGLCREYRYLSKKLRTLNRYTPRLISCFQTGSRARTPYCRVTSDSINVAFLCMERLIPYVHEIFSTSQWSAAIPDKFRQIALEQAFVLYQLRENRWIHRDLKNTHWMQRPSESKPQLVLIDYGLSEFTDASYSSLVSKPVRPKGNGRPCCLNHDKLTVVPANVPNGHTYLRMGGSRPGTIGFRPPKCRSNSGISGPDYAGDLWSLAVGWCAVLGVFPGRTREDCRKFENELYNAYQDLKQLHTFIQKHTSSSLVRSGENKSVMQWLKLIFQALNSHDIKSFYCSEYLFEPFYTPSTLEKLRTTGIIVRRDDIKPVLMMHVDAIGIIVLCLLYYDIDEVFAYYGGYLSLAKDGIEDMSLHNLPCGSDGVLCGAVSKYFSFEDYVEKGCIASFIMSSNECPCVSRPGTLHLADRYHAKQEGSMSVVSMKTRLAHSPGMMPTWSYNWNALSGEQLYSKQKVEELKEAAKNLSCSSHVSDAVKRARQEVLQEGHKDSLLPQNQRPVSRIGSYEELCGSFASSRLSDGDTLAGSSQPYSSSASEVFDYQPLPEDLVRCIEIAARECGDLKLNILDIKKLQRNSIVLENEDTLKKKDILVLKQMPTQRTKGLTTGMKKGVVFIDLSELALKSAEQLKDDFGTSHLGDLYARVCIDGPLESDADAVFWGTDQQSAKRSRKHSSGKHIRKATKKGILKVISAYLLGMPAKSWNYLFEYRNADGSVNDGDKRRSQSKGPRWEKPERNVGESDDSYLDRWAGFHYLPIFMKDVHTAVTKVLPSESSVCDSFKKELVAAICSDAEEGTVKDQIMHMDKPPKLGELCFGSLINLSDYMSYLGMLVNSCQNTKEMLQVENDELAKFEQRLAVTMSSNDRSRLLTDVLEGTPDEKLYFAWHHFFVREKKKDDRFMEMYGAYGAMPPLMMVLFDTDMIHWGAPHPLRETERNLDHFLQIHLRSQSLLRIT